MPPELKEKVGTMMQHLMLNLLPIKNTQEGSGHSPATQDVSPAEQDQASLAEQGQASPVGDNTQGEVGEQRMDAEAETESSGVEGLYQGEDQQDEEDEDAKGETDIESSSSEKA